MKKSLSLILLSIALISLVISSCIGDSGETSNPDEQVLRTIESQELELPDKRIVYQIPEMEKVVRHQGIIYHSTNGVDLKADIYLPPDGGKDNNYPVVILVNGYPDSAVNEIWGRDQKDLQLFVSWGELLAASGIATVSYQTQFSLSETDSLINFLSDNSEEYGIDIKRIGVFGASANTLAAQSLMNKDYYNIKCAVLYYGILLTPDHRFFASIDSAATMYGFYWSDLRPITSIPTNTPMLITKAGNDEFQIVTETTDYYVSEALKSNAHVTYIHYPEGQHDFDILDDTETSRLIIKQTVEFLKTYLIGK